MSADHYEPEYVPCPHCGGTGGAVDGPGCEPCGGWGKFLKGDEE